MRHTQFLITGGAGFIGSNLIRFINEKSPKSQVRVIDDFSTGLATNLDGSQCEVIRGSILDRELLHDALRGVECVVHLAAIGSVPRSVDQPRPTHEANVTGTFNVLEAARVQGIAHVTVASSSSVYGGNPKNPRNEFDWTLPLSPYAASKQAAEAYASAFMNSYGMPALALRFFNVYGPGQRADHPYAAVIPKFALAAIKGSPVTVHGNGKQTRDFTYVRSVCEALFSAAVNQVSSVHPVNLAFGTQTSVLEVIKEISSLTGSPLPIEFQSTRVGDIQNSEADPTLMKELFPEISAVPIADGLRETLKWMEGL